MNPETVKEIENCLNKVYNNTKSNEIKKITNDSVTLIYKTFPHLKEYKYIENNKLEQGNVIIYVNLNISHASIPAIIAKKTKDQIMLYNNYKNSFWYINPSKYYIFNVESKKNVLFKKYLEDYKKKINYKELKD